LLQVASTAAKAASSVDEGERPASAARALSRPQASRLRRQQRQLRRRRQVGQPGVPVAGGPPVRLRAAQGELRQHVVAEGDRDRRQRQAGVPVEPRQLGEQHPQATGVGDQEVEADVEACAGPGEGGADLEQRPLRRIEHLVRHPLAHGRERLLLLSGAAAGQVEPLDGVGGNRGEDPLPAVGLHHGAQHVVPLDQALPGPLQAEQIEIGGVDLQVDVSCHAAQLQAGAAADPVGLLEVGQGERLVALIQRRREGR
jgi:hypothetical protein